MPSAGALFFNRWPRQLDPLANALFVALDGLARRLFCGLQFMACNRRQM
jgi:hypothetical protein